MPSENTLVCNLFTAYCIVDWLALKGYRRGHDFTWEYLDDWSASTGHPTQKVLLFFTDEEAFLLVQLRFNADVKIY